jgi:hypothetical protein
MIVSKADLLKKAFAIEDVELPGLGTVKVRPLTRAEALALRGEEMSVAEMEQILISTAMVEPKLTKEEVREWQETAAAGDLDPVTDKIAQLSGMIKDQPKSGLS